MRLNGVREARKNGIHAVTGIAILTVLVVIGLGLVWSRMTTSRAERRSVDAYERQLDVLGHVAKRTDAGAAIHKPAPDELARTHVQPSDASGSFLPSKSGYQPPLPPRVRLEPPVPPNRSSAMPVFGDDVEAVTGRPLGKLSADSFARRSRMFRRHHARPVANSEPAVEQPIANSRSVQNPLSDVEQYNGEEPLFALDSLVESAPPLVNKAAIVFDDVDARPVAARSQPHRSSRRRRISDRTHRRALTGAAATIVVAAIAVGGWQIASNQSNSSPKASLGSSTRTHVKRHNTSPFSNTPGSSIQPVSTASGLVTYPAPSGTYTVSFSALSDCWLGIEPGSSSSGTYLAMKTLASADSWSYQANGSILVRIGAPKTLSVKINGETVALPSTLQPYDITFVPSSTTAA